TTSHLSQQVTSLAGGGAFSQIRAMNESPAVFHADNHATFGNRADFNWVEDNTHLELAGGMADNHPGLDFLQFGIGAIGPVNDAGHNHDDWLLGDEPELTLDAYTGASFNAVDVISQIGRYVDMDVDAAGNWSARESALDYTIQFSFDGNSWFNGQLVETYIQGWTRRSDAENYTARWLSPMDARFVRLAGLT